MRQHESCANRHLVFYGPVRLLSQLATKKPVLLLEQNMAGLALAGMIPAYQFQSMGTLLAYLRT